MKAPALVLVLAAAALAGAQPVAGPDPRALVGAPRGHALDGAALDEEAKRVAGLLRCPVCQGLSVADSPVGMAANMRQQVREMIAAGYDEEQVLAYFEKSYGEFVRLRPPLRGVNWLVWAGPLAGLLLGALVVTRALRAPRAEGEPAATEPAVGRDTLPEDPGLAAYVLRVRERVYGWPGGVSPAVDGEAKGR